MIFGQKTKHERYAYNLLDNSDFRNPVNQRGYVSGTEVNNGAFFIDRWRSSSEGGNYTFNEDGILMSANTVICQTLPLSDRTYTLAVYYANGVKKVFTFNGLSTIRFEDDDIIVAKQLGTYADDCATIHIRPVKDTTIANVALYEGEYTAETLPPYYPKGYAHELMECMRYYQRFSAPTSSGLGNGVALAVGGSNGNSVFFPFALPVPLRSTPTLSYSNLNVYAYTGGSIIPLTGFVLEYAFPNSNFISTYGTFETGAMTAKQMGVLRIGSGGYIAFSAEL